jgi:hypothetical protein
VEVEGEFWGPKKERVTNERHCSPDTVRHVSKCLHQSDTIDTCDSDHRPQATRKADGGSRRGIWGRDMDMLGQSKTPPSATREQPKHGHSTGRIRAGPPKTAKRVEAAADVYYRLQGHDGASKAVLRRGHGRSRGQRDHELVSVGYRSRQQRAAKGSGWCRRARGTSRRAVACA